MILQALAAANFLLGSYDAYITNRRMKAFGVGFELNGLIKRLSTLAGPDLASVIGVLGPCVGWTCIFCYFNWPAALALLVGYNLKRFEMQLASAAFEKAAKEMQKMINEFRGANESTLHSGELPPSAPRSNSKEGK